MNTHHVKYFFDAFRFGSVLQSATLNNVAPSTVSQAISILEREIGYSLTTKQRGTLELTPEGLNFAKFAPAFLEQFESIKNISLEQTLQIKGTIRIATHQSFLNSYLWKYLRGFRKLHPEVEIDITTGVGSLIGQLLENHHVDLAVTLDDIKGFNLKSLHTEKLLSGSFKLVANQRFEITKSTPCVVTNRRKPEVAHLLKSAQWLNIDSQVPSWTTILKIIEKEQLMGYLPDYLLELKEKTQYFEPHFAVGLRQSYQINLWYDRYFRTNPALANFIDFLKKNNERIPKKIKTKRQVR